MQDSQDKKSPVKGSPGKVEYSASPMLRKQDSDKALSAIADEEKDSETEQSLSMASSTKKLPADPTLTGQLQATFMEQPVPSYQTREDLLIEQEQKKIAKAQLDAMKRSWQN